jgi:tetratricopeptide (TPR) repeat protein
MPTPTPAGPTLFPAPAVPPLLAHSKKWIWAAVGLVVVLIAAALLILVLGGGGDGNKSSSVSKVVPVQPGEFMVLVAQLEPLQNAQEREVSRFIVESLKETLEQDVPFSMVRVRSYPQVITSDEQALAAAAANGATVMVWGNYTPELVELEIQIGVTSAFKYIQFDRATLERAANVRVHLTDERRESIATEVLGVVNLLFIADGNPYGSTNILAILDEIRVTSAEIVSGGVSGYLQRGAGDYFEHTEQAISAYDAAIALQPGNPLPYSYRIAAFMRLGMFDQALRDLETSRRLGPQGWTLPLFSEGMYTTSQLDYEATLKIFDQIVALRPDDGFVINYRGAMYYLKGEYDRAQADFDRAMALSPNMSYPYILSIMTALHQGRLTDLQAYIRSVVTQFPDPDYSNRLIQAIFGDKMPSIFGPMFAAAGNLILGQYNQVILDTQAALAIDPRLADMELAQGLAYCNLKDYAAAEAAYTRGIESQPDFIALYALRAEARLKQQKLTESLEDGKVVQNSDLADVFNPLLEAGLAGDWNCEQFFSYDYSQMGTVHAQ